MSAIVVSCICAMPRAVSIPCQCSILAEYLLPACLPHGIYHNDLCGTFNRYWTYTGIATRMTRKGPTKDRAPCMNRRSGRGERLRPDPETRELEMTALHPGTTVQEATGWELEVAEELETTDPSTEKELGILRELKARTEALRNQT